MDNKEVIKKAIAGTLNIIEQEREREIISRRFGLKNRKETLEQIGEMLGITRERVRQLEKAILIRLRIAAEEGKIAELAPAEKVIRRNLIELGRIARVSDLANKLYETNKSSDTEKAGLNFLASISAPLTVIDENDHYYNAVGIADDGTEKIITSKSDEIAKAIKEHKQPITLEELDQKLDYEHPDHIRAIASINKSLSTLGGLWGLNRWPAVNPKNIRDKIFIILENNKEPMHFADIAKSIAASEFKRKNVTTQAIHNELIKDSRFILVGRGIYALDAWGYTKGTVSDMIAKVLKDAKEPVFRDEIVKRVLKIRRVKETTILLNLQNRALFERVEKNTYQIKK
jgi:hypothetical protein